MRRGACCTCGRRRRRSQSAFAVTPRHATAAPTGAVRSSAASRHRQLPPEAIAVLGLDRRPVARPHFRRPRATPARHLHATRAWACCTSFPPAPTAAGRASPSSSSAADSARAILRTTSRDSGLRLAPAVTAVAWPAARTSPAGMPTPRCMLDIEVIGALAPAAAIAVYFAPNTDQGFYEAISQAAHDCAAPQHGDLHQLGRSGGQLERSRARRHATARSRMPRRSGSASRWPAATAARATGRATAQPHVDFPASSPVCAGLRRHAAHRAAAGRSQARSSGTRWPRGRGPRAAVSAAPFPLPAWQQSARRAAGSGRQRRARRARCGRQCGSADRLPGAGRRAVAGDRRHERRGAAVGGAAWRAATRSSVARSVTCTRRSTSSGARAFRDITQRQQRRLPGRARLGCVHRPRLAAAARHCSQALAALKA